MMHRTIIATLAFVTAFFFTLDASAQDGGCETIGDGRTACTDKRWRVLDRHSKAFELMCAEGDFLETLPKDLRDLCKDAEDVHRIWVRSEKADEAQQKARRAQRQSNLCKGSLKECRTARKVAQRKREEVRRSRDVWRVVAYLAGGVAIVSTGAVVGDRVGVWDLTPIEFR